VTPDQDSVAKKLNMQKKNKVVYKWKTAHGSKEEIL
jgi:hypothetical protein